MTKDGVKTELSASLRDAVNKLDTDATALDRFLRAAVADFDRVRPRILDTSITLVADQEAYTMPAGTRRFHSATWTANWRAVAPWERPSLARLPDASIREADDGGRELVLDPPPSLLLIATIGATQRVRYYAEHVLGDTESETTIQDADRDLLLVRAQAEAMKEIALRSAGKPVQIRSSGLGVSNRNSTPAALYDQLMQIFERQAMR